MQSNYLQEISMIIDSVEHLGLCILCKFTTKVSSIEYISSIEPNSGIDKYRRNQVSNQH